MFYFTKSIMNLLEKKVLKFNFLSFKYVSFIFFNLFYNYATNMLYHFNTK